MIFELRSYYPLFLRRVNFILFYKVWNDYHKIKNSKYHDKQ